MTDLSFHAGKLTSEVGSPVLLSVFTRHSADCKFAQDRSCRRCNCPKWVGGQVNGYYFRQSAKTRQWAAAEEFRIKLEEALVKGLPPFGTAAASGAEDGPVFQAPNTITRSTLPPVGLESAPHVPVQAQPSQKPRVTVLKAVDAYLEDAISRSLEPATLKKLDTIFRRQPLPWTRVQGLEFLDQLDLDALLSFRSTWKDGSLAKQKKQSRLIGFFWACVRRGYLTLYLSATALSEVLIGIALLPAGKRKRGMELAMQSLQTKLFAGRCLSFDREAAIAFALLGSRAAAKGYSISVADCQIAAIAAVHGFTIATRNTAPFLAAGVPVINPWES